MASINESNVTSLYFKSSTTRYRVFMHASMNNLFSLCMPIWWWFFFTRWNVIIKKRGKEESSKITFSCFPYKFHLFRLINVIGYLFNDYSIDPFDCTNSVLSIFSFIFNEFSNLVFFAIFIYIYINFILGLKINTVSKFKQLIKR